MTERNTDSCPYCGSYFKKPPKKATVCRECDNKVWVRTKQDVMPSDLLRTMDVVCVDLRDSLIALGVDGAEIDNIAIEMDDGSGVNLFDVLWHVSNSGIETRNIIDKDVGRIEVALMEKCAAVARWRAEFCFQTERDYKAHQKIEQSYLIKKIKVLNKLRNRQDTVTILSDQCCKECKAHNMTEVYSDDALEDEYIPFIECTRARTSLVSGREYVFCNCMYI